MALFSSSCDLMLSSAWASARPADRTSMGTSNRIFDRERNRFMRLLTFLFQIRKPGGVSSLVPQGDHGLHAAGTSGGRVTGQRCDAQQYDYGAEKCNGI